MKIVTIDTTGLKGRSPGWEPKIVAVGGAELDSEGRLVAAFGSYVQQSAEHVHDERAQGAWRANGIDPEAVIGATLSEQDAAFLLREWVKDEPVTGFNTPFLKDFLSEDPWGVKQLGDTPCVMARAAKMLSRVKRQFLTRVTLNDALTWALSEGYDLNPAPKIETRAEANAIRIALLSTALNKEEKQ